jgi:hypothetical protein
VWYALIENKGISPFFFEVPVMTDDAFVAMMENCFALCPSRNSFPVRCHTMSLLSLC